MDDKLVAERAEFERIHLGGNKQLAIRNSTTDDYVSPSINDAWAGWRSRAELAARDCDHLAGVYEGNVRRCHECGRIGEPYPLAARGEPVPFGLRSFLAGCALDASASQQYRDVAQGFLDALNASPLPPAQRVPREPSDG